MSETYLNFEPVIERIKTTAVIDNRFSLPCAGVMCYSEDDVRLLIREARKYGFEWASGRTDPDYLGPPYIEADGAAVYYFTSNNMITISSFNEQAEELFGDELFHATELMHTDYDDIEICSENELIDFLAG